MVRRTGFLESGPRKAKMTPQKREKIRKKPWTSGLTQKVVFADPFRDPMKTDPRSKSLIQMYGKLQYMHAEMEIYEYLLTRSRN
jgi:hypothetical protein